MRFAVEVDLRLRGVETEINRVVSQVAGALGRLETSGLRGTELGSRLSQVEVGGAAAAEQLRRQGVPETEIASLEASIRQMVDRTKRILDVSNNLGTFNYPSEAQIRMRGLELATSQDVRRTAREREVADAQARNALVIDEETRDRVQLAIDAKNERAALLRAFASTQEYIDATLGLARAESELTAGTQQALAADSRYIAATVAAANARQSIALQKRAGALGLTRQPDETDEDLFRRTAHAEQIRAAQRRADAQRRLLANEDGLLVLKVQERRYQRQLNQAIADRIIAEDRAAGVTGTFTQRFQQRNAARAGHEVRPVTDYATSGQLFRQSALTTLRYGATGALFYGGVSGFGTMIREAEELERILNQVKAQFDSMGQPEEFEGFRDSILEIARLTGAAGDEVALVAFQLKGAFQDTDVAARATAEAFKLVRVTGLEIAEVNDSLTAIVRTFGQVGREDQAIRDLGDYALGLQERFGVLAKETVTFVGDISAVAKEAGLTLRETAALGAAAQQASGRSGATLAEAFGRILPALSDASVDIVGLYQTTPALASSLDDILSALSRGETGDVLIQLIRDFRQLSSAEQDFFIQTIGGRREAQALIPVLQNSDRFIKELDRDYTDAGKSAQYFSRLQETLSQSLSRLGERFRQIGEALFRAGLSELLQDIAAVAGGLLAVLEPVVRAFGEINDVTGGNLARFIEIGVAIRLLVGAYRSLRNAAAQAAAAQAAGVGASRTGAALQGLAGYGGNLRTAYQTGAAATAARVGTGVVARGAGIVGGAGHAAVAALGGPVTVIVGSALATAATYASQRGDVRAQEKRLIDIINEADRKKLEEIGEIKSGFWDRVGYAIFGVQDPESLRRRELKSSRLNPQTAQVEARVRALQEAYGESLGSELQALLESASTEKAGGLAVRRDFEGSFADLVEKVAEGDENAIAVAEELLEQVEADPAMRRRLQSALKLYNSSRRKAAELAAATGEREQRILRIQSGAGRENAQETQRLYDAGQRTLVQLIQTYRYEIANYEALERVNALTPKQRGELSQLRSAFQTALSNATQRELAVLDSFGDISGEAPTVRLDRLQQAYRAAVSPEQRQSLATEIVKQQETIQQTRIDMETSAQRQLEMLQRGIDLAPSVRVDLTSQLLAVSTAWQTYLADFSKAFGDGAQFTAQVAEEAVETQVNTNQAAAVVIQREIARLQQVIRRTPEADAAELVNMLTGLRAALAEIQTRIARGETGVAPAPARTGPTPEELRAAQEKARQEAEAIAAAQIELERARAERAGDMVRVAQLEIDAADAAARAASASGDKAGEIRAAAQRIRAQMGLDRLMADIFKAQEELAIAVLETSGQVVEAADRRAANARSVFERAQRERPRDAQLLAELEAAAAQAEASARDTRLGEAQREIDVALQLQRITTNQAIAQLEGLLALPGITQRQTDELLLKIKQLRDEVGRDFQFNVPDAIALPTIYEVRRALQTTGAGQQVGAGYQDNRSLVVTLNVRNGMDQAAAQQFLADAFGMSTKVFGSSGRVY